MSSRPSDRRSRSACAPRSSTLAWCAALLLAPAVAPACASSDTDDAAPERGLAVEVAPLSLPGLTRACFDLRVTNAADGAGELVWARGTPGLNGGAGDPGAVCSDAFGSGAGGDISYIGPCDASGQEDADPAAERTNSVTLWVDGLYTAAGYLDPAGPDAWQDPCAGGCTLDVLCSENADARVAFDLTVLRDANQGFFDVAVTFEDIFCSAKVDCLDQAGAPLELLFDPATGARRSTVVATLACTAGPGAVDDTVLYRDPLVVTCGATPISLDPAVGPGNAYTADDPDPTPADAVWQYAVYAGDEDLTCGAAPCNKRYWNVAIGLDPTVDSCTLTTTMTAAPAGRFADFTTPLGHSYPLIEVDVPLTDAAGLVCSRHPLHGDNGVATTYSIVDAPVELGASFDGQSFASATPPPPTYATSCLALLTANPTAASGPYTIDPDGAGPIAPFATTCDMSTDGGGWTLVANQVPTSLFSTLTSADLNPQNDGSLTSTFRLGNTRVQAFTPTVGWRMTSHTNLDAVVDRGFFRPGCVIDWLKLVGQASGDCAIAPTITVPTSLDTQCGVVYNSTTFSQTMSAYTNYNCSLGIGQNNSGAYCSMRMGTTPWGTVPVGAALPCTVGQHTSLTMRLWVK